MVKHVNLFSENISKSDMIARDIATLKGEIMRLLRMPYPAWRHMEHLRHLDKQIEYLEGVLANFERDQKAL